MSNTSTLEQTLLKSTEDYIDHGNSIYEMHQIAHYLNMVPTVTSGIRSKFSLLFSDLDYSKIKKALELIEYLTIFSPSKVSQIINDDKFLEYISQTLMDPYLQDQALNLVKLWVDEYEHCRDDIDQVLVLVGNLSLFDLQLPQYYNSQYKSVAAGPAGPIGNPAGPVANGPAGHAGVPAEPILSQKTRDLINKAKEVTDNARAILESDEFDIKAKAFKINKLQILLTQALSAKSDLSEQKSLETSTEVKQRIDTAIKELKASRTSCLGKLDSIQNENTAQEQAQLQEVNLNIVDQYKIVVSPTDNNAAAASDSSSRMMEIHEFLSYKVEPCPLGAVCPHTPAQNQPAPMQTTYNSVMHCQHWHTREDKRRPALDQMNRMAYSFGICANSQACPKGETCAFSHNFFERLYHPLNYKKKKCESGVACRNDKYCPYYHSLQEKKVWNHLARGYFDAAPDDAEDNLEGNNDNTQEIPWKEPNVSFLNNAEDLEGHRGFKRSGAGVQQQTGYQAEMGFMSSHGQSSFGRHNQEKSWPKEKEQELSGVLHSKLIVRKKYGDPGVLSQMFHKSNVFSGFPFYSPYAETESKEKVENESNKEKQN